MIISIADISISKDYTGFQIINFSRSIGPQDRRCLFGFFTLVEDDKIQFEVYILFFGFMFGIKRVWED